MAKMRETEEAAVVVAPHIFFSRHCCTELQTFSFTRLAVIMLISLLQYLLHYLVSVKSLVNRHAWSRTPVAETSWALLRDCYHGDMCIRHSPQHLAVAALYLALNTYGVDLPVGEKEWWQVGVGNLLLCH